MIPERIIRSVPTETTAEVEQWWQIATELHPGWEMVTFRDPLDPAEFPITAPLWPLCKNGAQFAGLVRLEALWNHGGIWIDSDVELYRSLAPLLNCSAFAAWEDANVVPDAVIGATEMHPAIGEAMFLAAQRIGSSSEDWRTGNGAWSTGPGVTTTLFPNREDVLLLPPASFYPVHYTNKALTRGHIPEPFTFGIHHWAASWL